MDLSLFEFDPDLTFSVFFLNADRTIYGRYGTRSDFYDSERDMTLVSLKLAMAAALELHTGWPANRESLAGKQSSAARNRLPFRTLGEAPAELADEDSAVGESCRHCHHIGHARHRALWSAGRPIDDDALFAWPAPEDIGLRLSPRHRALVTTLEPDSAAARSGIRVGDEIVELESQPVISIADVQWVLHQTPSAPPPSAKPVTGPADGVVNESRSPARSTRLTAVVRRDGRTETVIVSLEPHWKRGVDLSWRTTTMLLRTLVLGGLTLREVSPEQRREHGLADDALALKVSQAVWSTTAAGQAGFRERDLLIKVDGRSDRVSESQLIARLCQRPDRAAAITFQAIRNGEHITLELPAAQ